MKEILMIVIFLVVWYVVNKYLLPKLGVPT
jgi:uncharacterized membrane protein